MFSLAIIGESQERAREGVRALPLVDVEPDAGQVEERSRLALGALCDRQHVKLERFVVLDRFDDDVVRARGQHELVIFCGASAKLGLP